MFAKVDSHWLNAGQKENGRAQIKANTEAAKKSGGVIARYSLWSKSDPLKVTTVTFWESKDAMEKWRASIRAQREKAPAAAEGPKIWAKVEGDEYDVEKLV